MKIAIAGISGFIGQEVARELSGKHEIVGLSRSQVCLDFPFEFRKCDLFSMLDAETALEGVDIAIYLVHSMLPSERLWQGNFEDYDLIAADNFAQACQKKGVKQIIYLGGLVPEDDKVSKHLSSRLEVEKVLSSYTPKLTSLRSGLILGGNGSTSRMLFRLVERLPVMILPGWTQNPTQAIHVNDVARLIAGCVGRQECCGRHFDIGSGEGVNYASLLAMTAKAMGLSRRFIPTKIKSPFLSYYWVGLISGAPVSLTRPIVESLEHPLRRKGERLEEILGVQLMSMEQALSLSAQEFGLSRQFVPHAFKKRKSPKKQVRSIQRLPFFGRISATDVAQKYLDFLSKLFLGVISTKVEGNMCSFRVPLLGLDLLRIELSEERSQDNRRLFYIKGGILNRKAQRERLEFRIIPGADVLLAGLHEYEPRLPWWLYIWTQAQVHSWVMKRFASFLGRGA